MADLVDMKSPYLAGHSRGVANLASAAALASGHPSDDAAALRRAGLIHDLGRLGVSNAVWDKPGPVTEAESERIRLHPYLTDRMLARLSALGRSREIAARHHERLDGSGYPRGLTAASLTPPDRLLAAADVYHAMTEPRPHRDPLDPGQASRELRAEVVAGRLDGEAADAVLAAAGHRAPTRRAWPGGLTAREVEVLGLLARGYPTKEIARRLVVTPKTAANHIEHIYVKLGVSSRAAATLYATQHGLTGAFEPLDRSSPSDPRGRPFTWAFVMSWAGLPTTRAPRWSTPSRSKAWRWTVVGVVTSRQVAQGWFAGDGVQADGGQVGEQAGEAVHWQVVTGALGGRLGQGSRGAGGGGDRALPGSVGGGLVVVGEQQGCEPGLHVPGDVVRDHPQEHVGADPGFGAVPDRADVQVGVERAEGPLDLGQGLVGRDDFGGFQVAGLDAGPQHVDPVQLRFGGDGVLVAGVAEPVLADVGGSAC